MKTSFTCPYCKESLEGDREWVGQEVDCPQCDSAFLLENEKPTNICPNCQSRIPETSILCVDCGYNLKTGKVVETASHITGDEEDLSALKKLSLMQTFWIIMLPIFPISFACWPILYNAYRIRVPDSFGVILLLLLISYGIFGWWLGDKTNRVLKEIDPELEVIRFGGIQCFLYGMIGYPIPLVIHAKVLTSRTICQLSKKELYPAKLSKVRYVLSHLSFYMGLFVPFTFLVDKHRLTALCVIPASIFLLIGHLTQLLGCKKDIVPTCGYLLTAAYIPVVVALSLKKDVIPITIMSIVIFSFPIVLFGIPSYIGVVYNLFLKNKTKPNN